MRIVHYCLSYPQPQRIKLNTFPLRVIGFISFLFQKTQFVFTSQVTCLPFPGYGEAVEQLGGSPEFRTRLLEFRQV